MTDAILKIKEAEDISLDKIDKSKVKASEIASEFKEKAIKDSEKIIEEARVKAKEISEKANFEGRNKAIPIIEEAKGQREKILNLQNSKIEEVVDLIVKEVTEYGNS